MQAENSDFLRDFSLRLQRAAAQAGLSQADIAAKLGILSEKSGRVNNWFQARHMPKASERKTLAAILGVRLEWLMEGRGEPQTYSDDPIVSEAHAEVGIATREVPVISWTHAGEAATYEAMPRHFQGKVPVATRDAKAFALRVEGESMEPKFFAGDLVIVEPNAAPRNGKPVVAKYANEEVQLRLYHKLPNGLIRLSSMRPEIYPTVDLEQRGFRWIFPVTGMYRPV